MNKLLKGMITLLLVLVAVSIVIRVGDIGANEDPVLSTRPDDITSGTTGTVETKPTETEPPTTVPETTAPPETEPPVVLTFAEDFSLESTRYFVYSCAEERELTASHAMDEKVYPASITKLFSAYVALEYLNAEEVIRVGSEAELIAYDSSKAYIKSGQRLTVAQLVEGMLLPSGNDAAYALAGAAARAESGNSELYGEEAITYFVDMMNRKAEELGMTGTHFVNPDGYHDMEHYTNFIDLVTIAKLALSNELIVQCTSTCVDDVTYVSGETIEWSNTNALINPESQYYCPDALGLKTGSTSYAGFCLLSAFDMEGDYIIIGSFGCVRPEDRFIDTLKLYELVLDAYGITEEPEDTTAAEE